MPSKISKTKPIVKSIDQIKLKKQKKETPKVLIKPRIVAKKTAITPPSFQSTTTYASSPNVLQANRIKKKKYPLVGLALTAFLITIICLLFIIYQNKSEWEKFAGKISQEKITKALDSLILPKIISDNTIAYDQYQLQKNSWSPDGNKLFVLNIKDDSKKEYEIIDLKNTTSTVFATSEKSLAPIGWLDENFLLFGEKIISFPENKDLKKPEIKKENLNDFPDFDKIFKTQNQSDILFKISPNGEYLTYIFEEHLWLMQKNLNESIYDFGLITNPKDNRLPEIEWSENSQFIIVNQNEVFDAINKKVILPALTNQTDARKTTISPDQTKISVIEKINNQPTRIYLINIEGYKEINVFFADNLSLGIDLFSAAFSANSQFLAFTFEKQLWLSETKTGKAKILKVADNNFKDLVFSPDDLYIAYTLDSGQLGIIKLDWTKNQ